MWGTARNMDAKRGFRPAVTANETAVVTNGRLIWRNVAGICWQALVLALIVAAFAVRAPQVSGFSMEPQIASGEFVLINTLAYRIGAPRRGDIVAFRHARSAPAVYLKRIIGLPGERVTVDRGIVTVDGTALAERYVRFNDQHTYGTFVIPPDSYYVLGDNRADSDDSRAWGSVMARDVIGKAIVAVWPFDRIGAL